MQGRFHLDIVDWGEVETIAKLVESRRMERGDLRFGPLEVNIYVPSTDVLRIEFREIA